MDNKAIVQMMQNKGYFGYGNIIKRSVIHSLFGIEFPEIGTQKDFQQADLKELAAVDFIRDQLLDQGKYIKRCDVGYRILLPSENSAQVAAFIRQSKKKLQRGSRLNASTPKEHQTHNPSVEHSLKRYSEKLTQKMDLLA